MQHYLDTHAHLVQILDEGVMGRSELERLLSGGFGPIIDIGTRADDLCPRVRVLGDLPGVYFSAGIWPHKEDFSHPAERVALLEEGLSCAPTGRLVAIGEAGLDRSHNKAEDGADLAGERELFARQADLARRLDLPIIVHSREDAEGTLEVLEGFPGLKMVIHCYSYGVEEARRFLDLGAFISFSGTITYKNARAQQEAARFVPLESLLVETDAPYLAPVPYRGKKNRPDYIGASFDMIAQLRGMDTNTLCHAIRENTRDIFGI